ncbi:MAG: c-type cytochrome biogenesis protein CcmI [Gammaproteobacteria bacterium]|nr:c-type cytochrome biogenesis protein CcmI [Gammaproteobacteria bacterium]
MTLFWFVIGGLTIAALLFVILPLLLRRRAEAARLARSEVNISIYRNQLAELEADLKSGDVDQEQFDKSRQEIDRRLLEDTSGVEMGTASESRRLSAVTAVVAGLVVPVVAVGLYLKLGNLEALQPEKASMAAASPHGDKANMAAQVEMMVGKLADKLQKDPSNVEGWVMLGRSYSVLNRYPEAVDAYKKAIQLAGEDPQLLADYADAIAMAAGESLEGEPMQWLEKSLKLDPNNQKALWLMGTAMFERGDFGAAMVYWEHLQKMLPPNSQDANAMQANIDEARSYQQRQAKGEFGKPKPSTASAAAEQLAKAAPVAMGTAKVSGTVSLNRELLAKAAPTDTLFVFARAVSGPPMPLAVVRAQVKDLPLKFTLDESMAMMPNMSLAKFSEVVVGARISKSGNAMPQSGDLLGQKSPVKVGSTDLAIAIDSVVP